MRILVISNFYPPYYIGGYELGCRDAVDSLKARGHEVTVLTSYYGLDEPELENGIYRWLVNDFGWKNQNVLKNILLLLKKEIVNQSSLKHLLKKYHPDVVYIWNPNYVSLSLAFIAKDLHYATCFF